MGQTHLRSNYSTFFVTKTSSIVLEEKANLVLSPEFYWVLKKELPVKYAWQAEKLAPSLFEEMIPRGTYRYLAIKKAEAFVLFAYDIDAILEALKQVCSDVRLVHKLYFAQNELSEEGQYTCEDKAFVFEAGILLMLPSGMVEKGSDLRTHPWSVLSRQSVVLERYRLPFSQRTYRLSVIALCIVSFVFGLEMMHYRYNLTKLSLAREAVFERNKLPNTSWQIQAIVDKHEKMLKEQLKLRDRLYHVTQYSYGKAFISKLEADERTMRLTLMVGVAEQLQEVQKELSQYFPKSRMGVEGMQLNVDVSYE